MSIIPDVKSIFSVLYEDKMTVFRYEQSETEYKTVEDRLKEVPSLTDVPCRISFASKDYADVPEYGNMTKFNPVLFCAPDVDLRSGDYVELNRFGRIYKGRLGEPAIYRNSLQVNIVLESDL